jgi:hypothetical protein
MINTNVQMESVEYIESYQCDVCKKTWECEGKIEDQMEIQEFTHLKWTGGYGSVFGDGVPKELDICQHCLKEKLGEWIQYPNDW